VGRIRKYNTPEEKKAAQNKAAMDYYWKNKKAINKKHKERYNGRKEME